MCAPEILFLVDTAGIAQTWLTKNMDKICIVQDLKTRKDSITRDCDTEIIIYPLLFIKVNQKDAKNC